MLQREVAAQIGVTEESIYNWETNRTEPEVQFIPKIINFLGYAPYDTGRSFGKRLKAIRSALGLSQEHFAKAIKVDESTVAKWEREEHKPLRERLAALKAFLHSLIDNSC